MRRGPWCIRSFDVIRLGSALRQFHRVLYYARQWFQLMEDVDNIGCTIGDRIALAPTDALGNERLVALTKPLEHFQSTTALWMTLPNNIGTRNVDRLVETCARPPPTTSPLAVLYGSLLRMMPLRLRRILISILRSELIAFGLVAVRGFVGISSLSNEAGPEPPPDGERRNRPAAGPCVGSNSDKPANKTLPHEPLPGKNKRADTLGPGCPC